MITLCSQENTAPSFADHLYLAGLSLKNKGISPNFLHCIKKFKSGSFLVNLRKVFSNFLTRNNV